MVRNPALKQYLETHGGRITNIQELLDAGSLEGNVTPVFTKKTIQEFKQFAGDIRVEVENEEWKAYTDLKSYFETISNYDKANIRDITTGDNVQVEMSLKSGQKLYYWNFEFVGDCIVVMHRITKRILKREERIGWCH